MRAKKAGGYSLVEVLVVSAILAALMAVLIPAALDGNNGGDEIRARATLSSTIDALSARYSTTGSFSGSGDELSRIASKVVVTTGEASSDSATMASIAAEPDQVGVAVSGGSSCLYARLSKTAPLVLYFVDDTPSGCVGERVVDMTPATYPAVFQGQTSSGDSPKDPVSL